MEDHAYCAQEPTERESPSSKKRKRDAARRIRDKRLQKSRINIGVSITRWKALLKDKCFQGDAEVACFLLDCEKQTFVCRPTEAIRSSERLNRTFAKTKMPHHWRASHMFVLLCAFSLCVEFVSGGTSFLSPAQKPQGRGEKRPPRTSRRDAGDPEIPVLREDGKFMVSAPFELGMSLSEAEYEKYGTVLQKILVNLLSNSPFE